MQPSYMYSQQAVDAMLLKNQQAMETKLLKDIGRSMANDALLASIVGIFICGILLEPYAIYKARQAKNILQPGEEGRGKATAAEVIGWILVILMVAAAFLFFYSLTGTGGPYYNNTY